MVPIPKWDENCNIRVECIVFVSRAVSKIDLNFVIFLSLRWNDCTCVCVRIGVNLLNQPNAQAYLPWIEDDQS